MLVTGYMTALLEELNSRQREAVLHRAGPLLILAGAGSGKTRVITRRVVWLIREGGVRPSEILAVTFTNKAAGEMRERIQEQLGSSSDAVWVSTFHSTGLSILREHGAAIGLPRSLVVYDDGDQLALLTRLMKDQGVDTTLLPPRAVRSRIDFAKSCGLGPDEMEVADHDLLGERARSVYRSYQAALRASGAVDFGDLLLETVSLLRRNEEVLELLERRLRYVMVDEFQDTSPVQYALVRLLTRKSGNLAVVGDDDQSIYGWRGADVRNILAFERDYPNAKVVRLEQNYRSTRVILDAAHAIIRRSPTRKEKRLFTDQSGGDLVRVLNAVDERDEAQLVARQIEAALSEGYSRGEMAVFYRVNAMSRVLEDALRERRIPYHVVRGRSFYERAEIKDITAYLRLAVNPHSDSDILRVINTPRRGIGTRTVERLRKAAAGSSGSIWSVLASPGSLKEVGPAAVRRLAAFREIIGKLHEMSTSSVSTKDIVREAMIGSGYVSSLEAEEAPEALERLENLHELLSVATERSSNGESLVQMLDDMALAGDADDDVEPEQVALMTLHAAKGLEFDVVFVIGMEERTFPHARAFAAGGWSEDEEALSEERRLCYVGFTRARRRLTLTSADSRWIMGERQVRSPSRFLEEIPSELIERSLRVSGSTAKRYGGRISSGPSWEGSPFPGEVPSNSDPDLVVVDYDFDQRPPDECGRRLRPGGRVRHRTFGDGKIHEVDGLGGNARLVICFDDAGIKKVLARYLEIL